MHTVYRRFSVIVGFIILLVLVAANAWITRRQLGVQVADQAWVARTRHVRLELSNTVSLIKDAETGQRGFLYTEDPKYLADYQSAIGQVNSHIDKLAQLTADNPHERVEISTLRKLSNAKLSELAQTITLYQSGKPDDAKALVKSDRGFFLMNDIRKLIGDMTEEENALWAIRLSAYRKSIRLTVASIYFSSLIAALGLILLAYYILREMELRERHARQIEEREAWFRAMLTSLGDAVIATDEYGRVTFLNPIAEQLMGISHTFAKGKSIREVFPIFNESTHQAVENPVKRVLEEGRIVGLANHTVLQKSDGTFIPIEDSAAPFRDSNDKIIGVVLVFRDATFERKTQDILRKSEKLAAAARLSATVAHEINNPLEAVGNLIYLTKDVPDLPAAAAEHMALAEEELERVSHITRQTLGFYRESRVPDQVEIQSLVESVLKIYSNKFKAKNITIKRDFGECPPIHGIAGELKQVAANLISNAADAVANNGTISVKLVCLESCNGTVVQLRVEDDGPGITAENRSRIFEPFFTTKKDIGTGLGLWITKEIVNRHGGTIEVHSRDSDNASGTAFDVLLPIAENNQNLRPI